MYKSAPAESAGALCFASRNAGRLVVHVVHAAGHGWRGPGGVRDVRDQGLRGQDHRGDAGRVFQGAAGDLYGVDDAALDHVAVDAFHGVEAEGVVRVLADGVDDDAAFEAGVVGDEGQWLLEALAQHEDAGADVAFLALSGGVEDALAADEGDTAAGYDAFF